MPVLSVNGARLHYVLDDFTPPWVEDAETVYIQHGVGRNLAFWTHWVPPLAGRFRVLRRDLRGHGESEVPPEGHEFSVGELVDDTVSFLEEIGVGPVHYVGESISGVTGIVAASRRPDLFASLTLCGTSHRVGLAERGALAGEKDGDVAAMLDRKDGTAWVRDLLIPSRIISGGDSPEQREWVIAEYGRTPVQVMQGITGGLAGLDVTELLPQLEVPTLILAPADSPIAPLEVQVAMREGIPGSRLAVVESPSHELYVDRAEECIAALLTFIGESSN